MFMLVARRYERASLIVTSNKPFSAWGEIFGDDATAAAMIDRLVHHAELISLKGDSYRLKATTSAPARCPPANQPDPSVARAGGCSLRSALRASLRSRPPHPVRGSILNRP